MDTLEQLNHKVDVLRSLTDKFGGRTLENIIQNIKAEIKAIEESNSKGNCCYECKWIAFNPLGGCYCAVDGRNTTEYSKSCKNYEKRNS